MKVTAVPAFCIRSFPEVPACNAEKLMINDLHKRYRNHQPGSGKGRDPAPGSSVSQLPDPPQIKRQKPFVP